MNTNSNGKKRTVKAVIAAVGLTVLLSACTPAQIQSFVASFGKHRAVASDVSLQRLRNCESGGNYRAVSSSGSYRGAYQFNRSTWNSVASRHYPFAVGADPANSAGFVQDAMARALISERGRSPWPHCGRYL